MKIYKIPCSWEVTGVLEIPARDLDHAIELAECDSDPLPEGDYIPDSFNIDHDLLGEYNNYETTNKS